MEKTANNVNTNQKKTRNRVKTMNRVENTKARQKQQTVSKQVVSKTTDSFKTIISVKYNTAC